MNLLILVGRMDFKPDTLLRQVVSAGWSRHNDSVV